MSFYSFVFGATVVQYNLHYLVKTSTVSNSPRLLWSGNNKNIHVILFCFGCVLILVSLFSFKLHHFYVLSILGTIAFLYSYPALPFGKRKRIKDYGLLKIITLALLWTLVTVWFPVSNMPVETILYSLVFVKRFLFMFVLCLLFDIRDIEIDRHENINTLPVILGRKKSYTIAYFGLLLFFILSVIYYFLFSESGVFIAMIISIIATFSTIQLTRRSGSDLIYLGGIDGMMLLQSVLVYLFGLKL